MEACQNRTWADWTNTSDIKQKLFRETVKRYGVRLKFHCLSWLVFQTFSRGFLGSTRTASFSRLESWERVCGFPWSTARAPAQRCVLKYDKLCTHRHFFPGDVINVYLVERSSLSANPFRLGPELQPRPKLLGSIQFNVEISSYQSGEATQLCAGGGGGIISSSYMISSSVWEWSTEFVVRVLSVTVDYKAAFQLLLPRVVVDCRSFTCDLSPRMDNVCCFRPLTARVEMITTGARYFKLQPQWVENPRRLWRQNSVWERIYTIRLFFPSVVRKAFSWCSPAGHRDGAISTVEPASSGHPWGRSGSPLEGGSAVSQRTFRSAQPRSNGRPRTVLAGQYQSACDSNLLLTVGWWCRQAYKVLVSDSNQAKMLTTVTPSPDYNNTTQFSQELGTVTRSINRTPKFLVNSASNCQDIVLGLRNKKTTTTTDGRVLKPMTGKHALESGCLVKFFYALPALTTKQPDECNKESAREGQTTLDTSNSAAHTTTIQGGWRTIHAPWRHPAVHGSSHGYPVSTTLCRATTSSPVHASDLQPVPDQEKKREHRPGTLTFKHFYSS